ncbi:predicted protein [Nematostella vectensis]|uniref:G-protein coupled receptors family 3 profile domain-containing protein n=1 Tax=Nematostella vectensis TaxID=45351 RepID=A7RLL8_NEMVE|nr:predicted protein [Nematostella vectensis]|eukprot:XP_001639690.1 predicted protein [Nematostella vectensis]
MRYYTNVFAVFQENAVDGISITSQSAGLGATGALGALTMKSCTLSCAVVFAVFIVANSGEFVSEIEDNRGPIVLEGDVILGGLFNVHSRSTTTENGCGSIDLNPGFQYYAAAVFAIDEINKNPNILPGVKLGARIYDTCRSQTIGGDDAMEIIKYTLLDRTNSTPPLAGVIGPFRSDVAVAVANLLGVFNIPQVSFGATTTKLSNKQIYKYFFRTVPPNSFQGRALVDVVRYFKWSYVMTVHSHGDYGEPGMDEVKSAAAKHGVCIAGDYKLPPFPKEEDFEATIKSLLDLSKKHSDTVHVVVMFCIQRDNTGLVRAAKKLLNENNRFIFVASNSWGERHPVTNNNEEGGEGALTLNFIDGNVKRFKDHLLSLTPLDDNSTWFHEFWQISMNCKLSFAKWQFNTTKECRLNEMLPRDFGIAPVRVSINAVYAAAHALHNMYTNLCPKQSGMCDEFRNLKRENYLKFLRNVTFPDAASNVTVRFNRNGEVDGNYSIVNFRKVDGKYTYLKVGSWGGVLKPDDSIEGDATIDESRISWKPRWNIAPDSYCSSPCSIRQITAPAIANPTCCWQCVDCKHKQYISNDTCLSCPDGHTPDANLTSCYKLPVVYATPFNGNTAQIVTFVVVLLGSISTICTGVFFLKNKDNRVIKASGRELSAILFIATLCCYLSAISYMTRPTDFLCGMRRFSGSVSLTACYAPVLLRTNRIHRIFTAAQKSVTRPSFTSPMSQVMFCLGIIAVQVLITCVWFLSDPPRAVMSYYDERTLLECGMSDTSVAMNLCYNIFLMLVATVYAFKTRNFPRNFNEAKYIGITMYISCAVWIIFLPCYLNAANSIWKSTMKAVALVAIATVTLLGLLVPRMYLVIHGATVGPETLTMTMSQNSKGHELHSNLSGSGRAGRYQTQAEEGTVKEEVSPRPRANSIHHQVVDPSVSL